MPPVSSRLDGSGFDVHLDQPRGLRQAQSGHSAQVRHGSRHAASCLVEHTLAPPAIAAQTRTFRRGLSGKFDGIAQFQKLADLIGIQYLGGLHTYLRSVAARLLICLHFQYHLAVLAVDNSERPPALPVMLQWK